MMRQLLRTATALLLIGATAMCVQPQPAFAAELPQADVETLLSVSADLDRRGFKQQAEIVYGDAEKALEDRR